MSYPAKINLDFNIDVGISGLSLALMSIFGDGRSVTDLLIGGNVTEWGQPNLLPPITNNGNSFPSILNGAGLWGEEAELEWR